MQRKFQFLVKKDKAETSSGGTRFTCGSQFSRKSVGSAFSCVLGKHASKVKKNKKNEPLGDSGNGKALYQLLALDREGEDRPRVKMNPPLLKRGWNNFMRGGFSSDGNNVVTRFGQVRRKASLRHFIRISPKILLLRLKLKMIKCLIKKKVPKQFEQDDDETEDRELCKKRIILGERCRPLSSPYYDTSSFFLPRGTYFTRPQGHP